MDNWTGPYGQFIDKLLDTSTPPPAEQGILWDSKQKLWMAFDYREKEGFLEEFESFLDACVWLSGDCDLHAVEMMTTEEKLEQLCMKPVIITE